MAMAQVATIGIATWFSVSHRVLTWTPEEKDATACTVNTANRRE